MQKPMILVTGATGKTGRPTVGLLLRKGYAVRAFVHRRDARSAALQEAGVRWKTQSVCARPWEACSAPISARRLNQAPRAELRSLPIPLAMRGSKPLQGSSLEL
jgi:nucleoside-diphosphate-sugar epimerase